MVIASGLLHLTNHLSSHCVSTLRDEACYGTGFGRWKLNLSAMSEISPTFDHWPWSMTFFPDRLLEDVHLLAFDSTVSASLYGERSHHQETGLDRGPLDSDVA